LEEAELFNQSLALCLSVGIGIQIGNAAGTESKREAEFIGRIIFLVIIPFSAFSVFNFRRPSARSFVG
jgi:hypothetical protein